MESASLPAGRYTKGMRSAAQVANAACPYVVAVDGMAVVDHRSSGSAVFMTYKLERTARAGLGRARTELPNAELYYSLMPAGS